MIILLIEDEKPKRTHIKKFLNSLPIDLEVQQAKSVNSALYIIEKQTPQLVLLDMSLPTFDICDGETGGRPQGFGGVEVLWHMLMNKTICPTIVITGFEAFSREGHSVGLSQLEIELKAKFPGFLEGLIHYNPTFTEWQDELTKMLIKLGIL